MLTEKEKILLNNLIKELKIVRKIDPNIPVDKQMDQINEDTFFFIGDFLIKNKFHKDRKKVNEIWEYLRLKL